MRALNVLVRHRRPLFGISWLAASYGFFAIYVTMAVGAVLERPLISGVAYALSGLLEERDILPPDRRSRSLSGWRRGLEIRSQWRVLLFIAAMVAAQAAVELTLTFTVLSLLVAWLIRVVRSRQLQLDTTQRIVPLGSIETGRDRLDEARRRARSRDLSELPLQASLGLASLFVSLPTATEMSNTVAVVLAAASLLIAIGYLVSVAIPIRRLRPAMLTGVHDREVLADFLSHDPEVICYFNGHRGSMYAVEVWLRTFEASAKRIGLVFRHRDVTEIGTNRLPAVVLPRDALCEKVVAPSTRVALYPANGTLNIHMQRDHRLAHVFLGHGDSDKTGSASPATRSYDRIWVSGPAGRERYQAAGLDIPEHHFDVIGRPPLAASIRRSEEALVVPADGESPFAALDAALAAADAGGRTPVTILYAPTWEGYFDTSDYSSVDVLGPQLIAGLVASRPGVRIIYKPHPMNGRRRESMRLASNEIREILNADIATFHPDTSVHNAIPLYRWFDLADLLITDVSSVLSDFMAWDRPYAVTNPRRLSIGEMHTAFPSTRAAYIIDGLDIELDVALLGNALERDPLAERRRQIREHYLGDPERDAMSLFDEQLATLWAAQGPHPVDQDTRSLMQLANGGSAASVDLDLPPTRRAAGAGDGPAEAAGAEDVEGEREALISEDG